MERNSTGIASSVYLRGSKDWLVRTCKHSTFPPTSVKFYVLGHASLYQLPAIQVKSLFVGSDFVGYVSIYHKIIAALITGK